MAPQSIAGPPLRVLHVGAGGDPLPEWLAGSVEVRLDIDPQHRPDVVASITDLGAIGLYERVLCSHVLEHLYPHEVPRALREFHRVLVPGGGLIIFAPDLEDARPTEEVLFVSPGGPVTGLDLFYGAHRHLEAMPHMAHHCGFTRALLERALRDAGFASVVVNRLGHYNLMAAAVKA